MANSTSSREKRRPIVESDGDPLNSSWQMWPSQAWTRASSRSYPGKSNLSDSFDSSAHEPPLPAQPPIGDVPRSSETQEASPLKPVRRFIPQSWKNFFQRWRREPELFLPLAYTATQCSPPVSPLSDRRGPARNGSSSSGFQEPSWSSPSECNQETEMSPPRSQQGQPALPSYEEKLEAYNLKYSYMKSWPGLLRLMAGLELLFGGMVFACVCAYIQKDYQWYNLYGGNLMSGGLLGGTITFLFITTLLYLAGALVCLKMWRHEMARKQREGFEPLVSPGASMPQSRRRQLPSTSAPFPAPKAGAFSWLWEGFAPCRYLLDSRATGAGLHSCVKGPYGALKYPGICCHEEREKYKAVFNDQYAEYKELYYEVHAALQKFKELDAMMSRLPRRTASKKEQSRVSNIWKEYRQKKRDPAFLEKQERCDYLKKKLAHIKAQIQEYDRTAKEGSIYF
uniref:OCEL domain-containing protein n=1 Tax=Gopherus evgoodei TaxID=1825980 RepID=A0A8C4W3I9_9SAUR